MSSVHNIEPSAVSTVLDSLLGREISLAPAEVTPHAASLRGLVTDAHALIGVIGSDLPFAHLSGAALALLPVGGVHEAGDTPAPHLIEIYWEVANVLSRIANEAAPYRLRIDPGMQHDEAALNALIEGAPSKVFAASIPGYGDGHFGFWIND